MRQKVYKPKTKRDRAAEALSRLRDRWETIHEDEEWASEKEPVVTPMLKSVEGGISHVLEAIRAHDDDDAQGFIETYDALSATDRKLLRMEDIAFASGISSLRLAEVAQTALYLYGEMKTKMLLSSAMPRVMKATIKAATDTLPIIALNGEGESVVAGWTNGDIKAQEMVHKMSGMMPLPKGAQIAIQNNFGEKKEADEKPALGAGWRSSEERLREIHDATEPKRLPSPAAAPIQIGGHIDHMQQQTVEILRGE